MDRLPPLNAVRAFEAVARHLSITLAAQELHVTPGAVSRQVQALEEFLGHQLLKREHRQVSLTRRGADYHRAATKALDLLRGASGRARKSARRQLKIRAYTTFAMRWLVPRLSGFHAQHPDVEVLLTRHRSIPSTSSGTTWTAPSASATASGRAWSRTGWCRTS